jgi:hypothetical protein
MFGKLKQITKDIKTIFLMLQVYGDDLNQLKTEVTLLKPKKKVVTKTIVKTDEKPVVKKK